MARELKKLWLVKYEVIASTLREALQTKGKVYSIELTKDNEWPESKKKVGFKHGKKEKTN